MVKILKEIGKISSGGLTGQLRFHHRMRGFRNSLKEQGVKSAKGRVTTDNIRPGDLIFFSYDGEERSVLIASHIFSVATGNKLVGGFQLKGGGAVTSEILKALYKKRGLSSYQNIKRSMKALIGPESYRTFNTSSLKMHNLYTIKLEL